MDYFILLQQTGETSPTMSMAKAGITHFLLATGPPDLTQSPRFKKFFKGIKSSALKQTAIREKKAFTFSARKACREDYGEPAGKNAGIDGDCVLNGKL